MQSQSFHTEIVSSLKPLEPISLFKIFGHQVFSFQLAQSPNLVDWSGFYTQLTPEHSLRYLTKKWNDGADFGCLVTLTPVNLSLRLLQPLQKYQARKKLQIQKGISGNHLLLQYLGKHLIVLKCIDCEDQQYIIPHQMLKQANFAFKNCMQFKKSQDGMLRTIGYRISEYQWTKVPKNYQFQPYLILQDQEVNKQLTTILEGKSNQ